MYAHLDDVILINSSCTILIDGSDLSKIGRKKLILPFTNCTNWEPSVSILFMKPLLITVRMIIVYQ